jgi:hypothetical protein
MADGNAFSIGDMADQTHAHCLNPNHHGTGL